VKTKDLEQKLNVDGDIKNTLVILENKLAKKEEEFKT